MDIPLAVIGGSGAYQLLADQTLGREIDCTVLKTPFGDSAPLHRFEDEACEFLFLSRHGEKDYSLTAPFVNYRANIYALKELGVLRIISWSGPGIINTQFKPGDFVVPDDLLDETRNRESTFFKNTGVGFIRQSEPFCPEIRSVLHDAVHELGVVHHEKAVYACTEGPRLETSAEIRKLRVLGADLVGMTLIPETFLARELEMCYASLCYLTNFAEGVSLRKFQTGQLFEGMQTEKECAQVGDSMKKFPSLLKSSLLALREMNPACHCQDALRRYKDKGMIGENWRTWFGLL